jgi:hypothetical protein
MARPHSSEFFRRARRRARAGFTLVELMVAMTGGLFLSIVVFALSRDASRFYQQETRVANATLSGLSGFERLSGDIARAGHLSTPNIQQDPGLCNQPQANWPAALQTLRAFVVEANLDAASTEVGAAGITPNGLLLSGALSTPEVLITKAVGPGAGGGWQVDLDIATPAAARVGFTTSIDASAASTNQTVLNTVFFAGGVGKIVRLRRHGLDQYAVVSAATGGVGTAFLTLAAAPSLQRLSAGGAQCGIDDTGKGMAVSVIDLVRYNIRSMTADPAYAPMFQASGVGGGANVPFEAGRAELVRVELDPNGQEIAATREIVAEYAVDLQVNAWGATTPQNRTLLPLAAATLTGTYNSTQLLRGVHVRLGVRSREADRDADVAGVGGGNNGMYRIQLGSGAAARFARVRTFQSDIPLRNLEGSNW